MEIFRPLFLIFLCHLYRKGVLLGAFDHRFPSVPKVVLWCDHRKEFAKCFNLRILAFVGGGYQTYLIPIVFLIHTSHFI